MKKWTMLALIFALLFAVPAAAQEAGVIVQSSCSIVPSGEYYMVYCFAQVHNNTDQVLTLDEGTFVLSGGDEILAEEEVSRLWPGFVAPGGDGYLFDIVPFDHLPQITGLQYDIQYLTINPAYAGVPLATQARVELNDQTQALDVICEIANAAGVDAFDPTVVVGLYTDAGQLVYADGRSLQDVGIAQDGKLLVRFHVEPMIVEQWIGYGALPTQVRADAMFRTGSD